VASLPFSTFIERISFPHYDPVGADIATSCRRRCSGIGASGRLRQLPLVRRGSAPNTEQVWLRPLFGAVPRTDPHDLAALRGTRQHWITPHGFGRSHHVPRRHTRRG
jgi:hypothetical protein